MSPLLRLILGNFRDEAVGWLMLYSTAISAPDCVRPNFCTFETNMIPNQ